ncbi:MAG: hypothetical protein LBV12_06370 [Puniceicoccales bacterium]|jgi:hypothetical protein|nr:hypothetical protein [Puniceicoccales bacterium]
MPSFLDIVIRARDAGASQVLGGVKQMVGGLTDSASNLLMMPFRGIIGPIAATTAGMLSLGGAIRFVRGGLAEVAEDEDMIVRLRAVSASAEEAKRRYEEIDGMKFSVPFDPKELVSAELTLARFTNNAWGGAEALRLISDLAAGSEQSVEGMAQALGRTYAEIHSGIAGRGMMQLQMSGVLTPAAKADLDAMIERGAQGEVVWEKLRQSIDRFGGAAEARMGTASGKMRQLSEHWKDVQSAFAQPLMESLTPLLERTQALMPRLQETAKSAGTEVSNVLSMTMYAFENNRLGELVSRGLKLAFYSSAGYFVTTMLENCLYIGQGLGTALVAAIEASGKRMRSWVDDLIPDLGIGQGSSRGTWMDDFNSAWSKNQRTVGMGNEPSRWLTNGLSSMIAEGWAEFKRDFQAIGDTRIDTARNGGNFGLGDGTDSILNAKNPKKTDDRFTDAYARIGLFVGGGGMNLTTSYQRRTADAGDRTVRLLETVSRTLESIKNSSATPAASWS